MQCKHFSFLRSYYEAACALENKEDQAEFLLAVCAYALDGIDPDVKGVKGAMFKLVKPNIDASLVRQKSASKGGEANSAKRKKQNEVPKSSKRVPNECQTSAETLPKSAKSVPNYSEGTEMAENSTKKELEITNATEVENRKNSDGDVKNNSTECQKVPNECRNVANECQTSAKTVPKSAKSVVEKGDRRKEIGERNNNTLRQWEIDFENWWKEYPRKVAKANAKKSFDRVRKNVSVDVLIEAVRKQKQSTQWQRDGGQYIPHPATWLNQGRWEDEVENNGHYGNASENETRWALETDL